jgi:hypothetical protein
MRSIILASAAALALAACQDMTVGGITLTPADQQCLATGAAFAVKNLPADYADMSFKQRGIFMATAGEGIATECGVDISTVKPYLDIAVMVASD